MAFRTNSSKANEGSFSLKGEGYYEVLIENYKVSQTQNGKQYIGFRYVIRNDVQQKYQNGLIFHSVWKKKEPNEDDMQVEGFHFGQLMAIAQAARIPDNQEFAGLDEFLKALCGKAVKVHLYHDTYEGKTREKIDFHQTTEHPEIKHKPKTAPAADGAYAAKPAAQFAAAPAAPAEAASEADDDYPF